MCVMQLQTLNMVVVWEALEEGLQQEEAAVEVERCDLLLQLPPLLLQVLPLRLPFALDLLLLVPLLLLPLLLLLVCVSHVRCLFRLLHLFPSTLPPSPPPPHHHHHHHLLLLLLLLLLRPHLFLFLRPLLLVG